MTKSIREDLRKLSIGGLTDVRMGGRGHIALGSFYIEDIEEFSRSFALECFDKEIEKLARDFIMWYQAALNPTSFEVVDWWTRKLRKRIEEAMG